MSEMVEICDVAPRDGFQAVKTWIPTEIKIDIVRGLAAAGLKRVETGAFVSPKHVPQMADSVDVHKRAGIDDSVRLSALVPNLRGAENALAAGVNDIVYVFSASEAHNQANVRRPVSDSIAELGDVIAMGRDIDGFKLRVNVATVFDCPFDGDVAPDVVYAALEKCVEFDFPMEFGLCDTTGRAIPAHVATVCAGAIERFGGAEIGWAFHGHDTFGLGVANALYAYDAGVRVFDAAVAGLGGCPFAPGATGNTATEDLVFTFENSGIRTGIDLSKLLDIAETVVSLPDADTGGHVRLVPRARALAAA